jgi:hypothetical protein
MKILINSLPRSGSSYLRSMLNQQMFDLDDYFSISEPFNFSKNHKLTKQEIIHYIKNKQNVLIKRMIFEPNLNLLDNLFDYTICLSRKNLFDATLSRVIALKTNIWDKHHNVNLNLKIDFFEFKYFLDETKHWNKKVLTTKCDKLIFYEDLKFNSFDDLKLCNNIVTHSCFYQTNLIYKKETLVTNYLELKEKSEEYLKND